MIPALLLIYALGYLFRFLAYLQRRWVWGALLLLCCMGMASMFESDLHWLQRLRASMNAPSVGGYTGHFFYQYILRFAGKVGATIVLGAVYLVSLIYLTNFKLGEWCRESWAAVFEGKARPANQRRERIGTPRARIGKTGPPPAGAIGKIRQGRRRAKRFGRRRSAGP